MRAMRPEGLDPGVLDLLETWRRITLDSVRGEAPDLSQRQMAVLLTVYLQEPPHTVRGLAEALGVGKPVITRALDALSQMGFLKRTPQGRVATNLTYKHFGLEPPKADQSELF